jgi:hypothetical protein
MSSVDFQKVVRDAGHTAARLFLVDQKCLSIV